MQLHKYLALFSHLISNGLKQEDGKYQLEELCAWHDHDGYTCYIGYKDLTMSIYFHSRYAYDFDDEHTLSSFESLVESFERKQAFNA